MAEQTKDEKEKRSARGEYPEGGEDWNVRARDQYEGEEEKKAQGAEREDGARDKRSEIKQDDEIVDETSEDSFPASDPPSYSGAVAGKQKRR